MQYRCSKYSTDFDFFLVFNRSVLYRFGTALQTDVNCARFRLTALIAKLLSYIFLKVYSPLSFILMRHFLRFVH